MRDRLLKEIEPIAKQFAETLVALIVPQLEHVRDRAIEDAKAKLRADLDALISPPKPPPDREAPQEAQAHRLGREACCSDEAPFVVESCRFLYLKRGGEIGNEPARSGPHSRRAESEKRGSERIRTGLQRLPAARPQRTHVPEAHRAGGGGCSSAHRERSTTAASLVGRSGCAPESVSRSELPHREAARRARGGGLT